MEKSSTLLASRLCGEANELRGVKNCAEKFDGATAVTKDRKLETTSPATTISAYPHTL